MQAKLYTDAMASSMACRQSLGIGHTGEVYAGQGATSKAANIRATDTLLTVRAAPPASPPPAAAPASPSAEAAAAPPEPRPLPLPLPPPLPLPLPLPDLAGAPSSGTPVGREQG
jgi:hypothetical protein